MTGTGHLDDDPRALVGTWQLRRTIDDRRTHERLEAHGTLVLTLVDPSLISWYEEGVLRRSEGETPFHRRLRVTRASGPDEGWTVTFDDGRDFHPWTPGEAVEHPCGPDTYRGLVAPVAEVVPFGWRVTWEVVGPGKDYTMVTDLTATSGVVTGRA